MKMLGKARGVTMVQLAKELELSYTALNARLAGVTHFTAFEIQFMADFFGIEPGVFFRPPLELVGSPTVPGPGYGLVRSTFSEPRRSGAKRHTISVNRCTKCDLIPLESVAA